MKKQLILFLSHAHADAAIASTFAIWLEQAFCPAVKVICTSRPSDRIDSEMVASGLVKRLQQSKVALAFLTPRSIASPWVYYEMGAAHALNIRFVPCLTGRLTYRDLPPQAYEYQGALLQEADGILNLVRDLSSILDLTVRRGIIDAERLARKLDKASAQPRDAANRSPPS
jgi:hypothetical protein